MGPVMNDVDTSVLPGAAQPSLDPRLDSHKFRDPAVTAMGEKRATVGFETLRTLWFNTGTLCNLTCRNCYIESSPTNDRLVYLTAAEVHGFLDEIARDSPGTREIGFTGGEPFLNPDVLGMLDDSLSRGFRTLALTNAMKPMMRLREPLLALREKYGALLVIRVSLDHYSQAFHEIERGPRSFTPTLEGLRWLSKNSFATHVAGRTYWNEPEESLRQGYARLFAQNEIAVDAFDPVALILFPEMNASADVPEITEHCWNILGVNPQDMMCASSRMVLRRRGAERPAVVACTLIAYDEQFELGGSLAEAARAVSLNHPHCARFCVLGGGACSRG